MPIPLAIYDDRYTWAKYGQLILPEVFKLNEAQNSSILGMYRNFLRDFLRIDLEGNISKTLNVSMKSKLNEYLSSLFKEISETATKERTLDEYMNKAGKKTEIIKRVLEIAVSETSIPLSIFSNLFHQRFSKHDYLESTLEILQQFYIKMHSDHKRYCLIPRDLCKYTLKCVHCDKSITPGTIGETLYHAPVAILRHWEMIDHQDHPINPPGAFEISHVPLLFSGVDTFGRAQVSFLATLTEIGDNDHDGMFCSDEKGEKMANTNFVKRLKLMCQKQRRQIFKQVSPTPLWYFQ